MEVCFVHAGVEGSAHDASVLLFSRLLAETPANYFLLVDAGYALLPQVLTPYRGARYRLKEWVPTSIGRPQNVRELFNLRHAKA